MFLQPKTKIQTGRKEFELQNLTQKLSIMSNVMLIGYWHKNFDRSQPHKQVTPINITYLVIYKNC